MHREYNESELRSQATQGNVSKIAQNGLLFESNGLPPQCAACPQQEYSQLDCELCGQGFSLGSNYSGHEPEDLVVNHEKYQPKFTVRTVNKRRHPRIPCRNMLACIRTEFASIVVEMLNISQMGLCFKSAEQFCPGTEVSVAAYYVEGGQNIFQGGRIVRAQYRTAGILAEYGVEFSVNQRPGTAKK